MNDLLKCATHAYSPSKPIGTILDYSAPSNSPRLSRQDSKSNAYEEHSLASQKQYAVEPRERAQVGTAALPALQEEYDSRRTHAPYITTDLGFLHPRVRSRRGLYAVCPASTVRGLGMPTFLRSSVSQYLRTSAWNVSPSSNLLLMRGEGFGSFTYRAPRVHAWLGLGSVGTSWYGCSHTPRGLISRVAPAPAPARLFFFFFQLINIVHIPSQSRQIACWRALSRAS